MQCALESWLWVWNPNISKGTLVWKKQYKKTKFGEGVQDVRARGRIWGAAPHLPECVQGFAWFALDGWFWALNCGVLVTSSKTLSCVWTDRHWQSWNTFPQSYMLWFRIYLYFCFLLVFPASSERREPGREPRGEVCCLQSAGRASARESFGSWSLNPAGLNAYLPAVVLS